MRASQSGMASGQDKTVTGAAAKGDFANPVRRFANRVISQRSERILLVVSIAATLFCGLSGPFGTFEMPLMRRFAFWSLLIGFNGVLWGTWFRWRMDGKRSWQRVAAEGAVLFSLPMPAEISLAGRLLGATAQVHWPAIWLYTFALAGVAGAILLFAVDVAAKRREPKGLLWREGFGQGDDLAMIRAEDHFCRLVDFKGREKLVYARFSDLEGEVAALDGLVIRRGCWVAANAVSGSARTDRKWVILLKSGERVPVPEGKVNILRAAGWI